MGLFDKILNSDASKDVVNIATPTSSYVRNTPTNTPITVDEETALKIGALYQGINIIGDTIASMPVYLYKNSDGFTEVLKDDPRSRVMSIMANETLSAFNMKKSLIKDLILHGNAYAKIEQSKSDAKLFYLPVKVVTPKKDSSGYYYDVQSYSTDVNGENYPAEQIDDTDMLVLVMNNKYNSVTGVGLLEYAKDVLGLSLEESSYMLNLFRNGLSAKALLTSKTPFKREIKEQLKRDLKDFYSGSSNAGKMMVLEGDIGVTSLSLSPSDIKLIENKHFTISEISRFLNIQKHLLNLDRQQGTYSNITSERMMLLQNTLMPYVTMMEGAMNAKFLTPQEIEQGYYFAFDTSEMLRLTPQDQAEYMVKLYEKRIINLEEVRANLGLGADAETIAELKELQQVTYNTTINEMQNESKEQPTEDDNTPSKDGKEIDKKTSKEVQDEKNGNKD